MASATLISVSEYLRSDYEPDAEYVEGEIEERPMGERDHSGLQIHIGSFLNSKQYHPYFRTFPEIRVQVAAHASGSQISACSAPELL